MEPVPRVATSCDAQRVGRAATALFAVVLMLVGAVGPWMTTPGVAGISGLDGSNALAGLSAVWGVAWPIAVTGTLAVPVFVGYALSSDAQAVVRAAVTAVITSAVGVAVCIDSQLTFPDQQAGPLSDARIVVGWGLNLATVGSGLLALIALTFIFDGARTWWERRRVGEHRNS